MFCSKRKWSEFAGISEDTPNVRICSDHFSPKLIWKKHPRPLLVSGAVPTIHTARECGQENQNSNHINKLEFNNTHVEGIETVVSPY